MTADITNGRAFRRLWRQSIIVGAGRTKAFAMALSARRAGLSLPESVDVDRFQIRDMLKADE